MELVGLLEQQINKLSEIVCFCQEGKTGNKMLQHNTENANTQIM